MSCGFKAGSPCSHPLSRREDTDVCVLHSGPGLLRSPGLAERRNLSVRSNKSLSLVFPRRILSYGASAFQTLSSLFLDLTLTDGPEERSLYLIIWGEGDEGSWPWGQASRTHVRTQNTTHCWSLIDETGGRGADGWREHAQERSGRERALGQGRGPLNTAPRLPVCCWRIGTTRDLTGTAAF